jgi:DNA invertase Pin-like site-specific DNA recombinase
VPGHLSVVHDPDEARPRTPLRALIYARVSEDRHQRGKSTNSQLIECREDAKDQGYVVVREVVDPGLSASRYARKERPGWREVVSAIEAGEVDVLVMWEFSRATRNLESYIPLRDAMQRHGVLLCVQGDVSDLRKSRDLRRIGHDAVDAEADSGQTSERVRRAKANDAKAGWPTGMVPYGYRRRYDPDTGHLLRQEPDTENTAIIVRELVDRFLAGTSLNALAVDMARRGIPTPKPPRRPESARGWTAATVGQILRSPSIAGLRQHTRDGQRVYYDAAWDGIITRAERDQILAILSDPRRVVHRGITPTHLLSHVAVCGLCGTPVRHRVKRQEGVSYPAYTCDKTGCCGVYIQAPPADDLVAQAVIAVLGDPASLPLLAGDDARSAAHRAEAALRVAELEAEIAALESAWRAREFSAVAYARALSPLEDELAGARAATTRVTAGPAVLQLASAADVARAWAELPVTNRRQIIRALWEIRLHPAAVKGTRRWDPRRVELLPLAR